MTLPFTGTSTDPAKVFVTLLLRPVADTGGARRFSGKIDGGPLLRAGQPGQQSRFRGKHLRQRRRSLPAGERRALDAEHWTGHTGCVILAPHLVTLQQEGPRPAHISEATERQRRDGMCWNSPDELYNDGGAFKITCRDQRGVIVTLIADNYYGYCKKEVKTQISYAANLFGNAEEEHAGGAIAFPSFDLGEDFSLSDYSRPVDHTFSADRQTLWRTSSTSSPRATASTSSFRTSTTSRRTSTSTCTASR